MLLANLEFFHDIEKTAEFFDENQSTTKVSVGCTVTAEKLP